MTVCLSVNQTVRSLVSGFFFSLVISIDIKYHLNWYKHIQHVIEKRCVQNLLWLKTLILDCIWGYFFFSSVYIITQSSPENGICPEYPQNLKICNSSLATPVSSYCLISSSLSCFYARQADSWQTMVVACWNHLYQFFRTY
jgi:hypothetical protein